MENVSREIIFDRLTRENWIRERRDNAKEWYLCIPLLNEPNTVLFPDSQLSRPMKPESETSTYRHNLNYSKS